MKINHWIEADFCHNFYMKNFNKRVTNFLELKEYFSASRVDLFDVCTEFLEDEKFIKI